MSDVFEQYYRFSKRHIDAQDAPKVFESRGSRRVRKMSSMLREGDELVSALTGDGGQDTPPPEGGSSAPPPPSGGGAPPPAPGGGVGGPPPPAGGPPMGGDPMAANGPPSGTEIWKSLITGVSGISQAVDDMPKTGTDITDDTYQVFKAELENLYTQLTTQQSRPGEQRATPEEARNKIEDTKTTLELALRPKGEDGNQQYQSPESISVNDVYKQVINGLEDLILQIDTSEEMQTNGGPEMAAGPASEEPAAAGGEAEGETGGEKPKEKEGGGEEDSGPPPLETDRQSLGQSLNAI